MTNLPDLLHQFELPAETPELGSSSWRDILETPFSERVHQYLDGLPTTAQERFFSAVMDTQDILFCVRTGGGKTVTLQIWILYQTWLQQQGRCRRKDKVKGIGSSFHVVVLFPTNNLLGDFEERLRHLSARLAVPCNIIAYTSRSPMEERRKLRSQSGDTQVFLLTLDMWKESLLRNWELGDQGYQSNREWARILLAPDLLIIEEFDVLRGHALSALNLLLSIVRRVAKDVRGAPPQIVLTSATATNPKEVSKALLPGGVAISGLGRHGKIHILALSRFQRRPHGWQDKLSVLIQNCLPPDSKGRVGKRILTIIDDRSLAEKIFQKLDLAAKGFEIVHGNLDQARNLAVVEKFKRGEVRGLIATTIINRGIDVGELDRLIMVGLPMGGLRDVIQSLGRVARQPNLEGVVFHLLDRRRPQEEGLVRKPEQLEELYRGTTAPVVVPSDRHHALKLAVLCALILGCRERSQLPSLLPAEMVEWLPSLVVSLRAQGLLQYTQDQFLSTQDTGEEVHNMPLRGSQRHFEVKNLKGVERVGKLEIGEVVHAMFRGDRFLLGGKLYDVIVTTPTQLLVQPSGSGESSSSIVSDNWVEASLGLTLRGRQQFGGYTFQLCDVHQQLTPTKRILKKLETDTIVEELPISLEECVHISLDPVEGFTIQARESQKSLITQTLAYALLATAYVEPPNDVQVLITNNEVIIADRPGAIGATQALYHRLHNLLPQVAERLGSCSCYQAGCPACIYLTSPPSWRTNRSTIQHVLQLIQNPVESLSKTSEQYIPTPIQSNTVCGDIPSVSIADRASWRTLFGASDGRREVEVIFSDLHLGHPKSRWQAALFTLSKLLKKYRVFAVYFAGDTVELRYAHEAAPSFSESEELTIDQLAIGWQTVETIFNHFVEELKQLGVVERCIFITGNHDTRLELLPRNHALTILPYAKLSCPDFKAYIFHGHGLGLEAAVHRYGKGGAALQAVHQRLQRQPPPLVPKIFPRDLIVVGHYSVGVCDLDARVVGLGEWTGDLNNPIKACYAVVELEHPEAPVRLGRWGKHLI